ncbi:MAG: hypothetical protein JXC33_10720 [Deltaproteobacteria bacterium]|nr:hypothetical protein [Deltaproteobacteria bacterium]
MKKILCILAIVVLLAVGVSAPAEDSVGRYQALKIGTAADAYGIFIIDTKDGHIWVWAEGETSDGRLRSRLRYGGKLIPNEKGDVTEVKGLRK